MKNKNILSLFILSTFITSSIFCAQPATVDKIIALEESKITSLKNKLASLKPSTPEEQIEHICITASIGVALGAFIGCVASVKMHNKLERKAIIVVTLLFGASGVVSGFMTRHDNYYKKCYAIVSDINTSNNFINNLLLSKEQVVRSS